MNSRPYLLDASALLALVFKEPGFDVVLQSIDESEIHAVNLTEVITKLASMDIPEPEIRATIGELELPVIETFASELVFQCGMLGRACRLYGLSLGDRICLTVALSSGKTVITADRKWSEVPDLGVHIVQLRHAP